MPSLVRPLFHSIAPLLAVGLWALAGCGDPGATAGPADVTESPTTDAADDAGAIAEDGAGDSAVVASGDADAAGPDAGPDAGPALALRQTIPEAPSDPLAEPGAVTSCDVYLAERCESGTKQVCAVYDTGAGAFTDSPDPLLERVYLYDRWYDLYHSPDGQAAERLFKAPVPAGTPESEWGAPENFELYIGKGDAAMWSSAALSGALYRYAATGTEADYQRMEEHLRLIVRLFDVTGVPGYLARHHFLWYPEGGAVQTDEHMVAYGPAIEADKRNNVIEDPASVEGLPAAYFEGLPDADGDLVQGTPMWNGYISLDQYTGPAALFPAAYPLLRDEDLKARIVEHMTCYLKRLRRMEIVGLQDSQEALDALAAYFGGGGELMLDEGDIDLLTLDRIVIYYHPGINWQNKDTFDRSCPDTVALEPTRIIDATSDTFLFEMLEFGVDLDDDGSKPPRDEQIDHFYAVNVRGGDASHLIHLTSMAYGWTGDPMYLDFLYDELIGELEADRVTLAMQALRLPDYCYRFYGDHITYNSHWQLITMLPDGPLRDTMVRAMDEELWSKALYRHHDAKFNVVYAASAGDDELSARGAALEMAILQLERFGGNGGVENDPRRAYLTDPQDVLDALAAEGSDIGLRCPTEEERAQCEDGGELFGIPLPDNPITFECDGRANQCVMEDGSCTNGIATEGLPSDLRDYSDFMWQRNPYRVGSWFGPDARVQSPGRDLAEPYWMARYFGFITDGSTEVLAWKDDGACP